MSKARWLLPTHKGYLTPACRPTLSQGLETSLFNIRGFEELDDRSTPSVKGLALPLFPILLPVHFILAFCLLPELRPKLQSRHSYVSAFNAMLVPKNNMNNQESYKEMGYKFKITCVCSHVWVPVYLQTKISF